MIYASELSIGNGSWAVGPGGGKVLALQALEREVAFGAAEKPALSVNFS